MPELLTRRSPLDGLPLPDDADTLAVAPAASRCRFILRADEATASHLGAATGVALAQAPRRAVTSGDRAALWLGPDEWLLLAPEGERETLAQRIAATARALSLVDIGGRQIGLIAAGPRVENALNAFCPLDLALDAFPVGACARTLFGKAEIVLWRTAALSFHLEVARSFVPYVAALLAAAASELIAERGLASARPAATP